jgi:hypothetical protein
VVVVQCANGAWRQGADTDVYVPVLALSCHPQGKLLLWLLVLAAAAERAAELAFRSEHEA